ncbi:MAG: hypothetical protein ACK5OB_02930 [Pirellula sp.]
MNPTNHRNETAPSSRTKFAFRFMLVSLIAFELGLIVLLRTIGWDAIGSLLHWSLAIAVVVFPLFIVAITLMWNRFRFGTRSLLAFMVCAAIFFTLTALPYHRYQNARRGVKLLHANNIHFDVQDVLWLTEHIQYLDQPAEPLEISQDVLRVPFWLSPLVQDIAKLPVDQSIHHVVVRNDGELEFFLRHHRSFEGLKALSISDPSDWLLDRLDAMLVEHPQLIELQCNSSSGTFPPNFWRIVRERRIPILAVFVPLTSTQPFLPEDLHSFDALRVLRLSTDRNISRGTTFLQDADAAIVERCGQLRCLELYGLEPKSLQDLRKHLPNCDFDRDILVE